MNIILLEKIKKLGDIGDEVKVKSGYARNFLVPNKKAHYTMLIIESQPDKIEEYERKLRLNEDVIRFMTIKIKTFDGKQSKMVETIDNE